MYHRAHRLRSRDLLGLCRELISLPPRPRPRPPRALSACPHSRSTPTGGLSVHFLVLDTVVMAGHSGHDASSEGKSFNKHRGHHGLDGSELKGPVGLEHEGLAVLQWEWLESRLKASTADFIVVAGHYPVWSVCEHGPTAQVRPAFRSHTAHTGTQHSDTLPRKEPRWCLQTEVHGRGPQLLDKLKPLLDQYGVDAYLAGHDHCAQHISDSSGKKTPPTPAEVTECGPTCILETLPQSSLTGSGAGLQVLSTTAWAHSMAASAPATTPRRSRHRKPPSGETDPSCIIGPRDAREYSLSRCTVHALPNTDCERPS